PSMKHFRTLVALSALLTISPALRAAPAEPPPPPEYFAFVRYKIDAFRHERVVQFREMKKYLESIGFKKEEPGENEEDEEENPRTVLLRGTIASGGDGAKVIANLLRERHVQMVMLVPADAGPPAPDKPVRVDIQLAGGPEPERQRVLADLTRAILRGQGFVE